MKKTALVLIVACSCLGLQAQAPKAGQERFLLPKDTFWGYAQFEIAPPHNEIDPNLCAANAGNYGGKSAPCNAFARYMARQPGTYAILNTTEGTIVCRLFEKDAPKTVRNFSDLAEGKREWRHPSTGKKSNDRLYDGTIFHRVIPDFMTMGSWKGTASQLSLPHMRSPG